MPMTAVSGPFQDSEPCSPPSQLHRHAQFFLENFRPNANSLLQRCPASV